MNILTKSGEPIDFSPWEYQVKCNIQSGRGLFSGTPIGRKADGTYFWWGEDKNPDLNKWSVSSTVKKLAK